MDRMRSAMSPCSKKTQTSRLYFDNLVLTVLWMSKLGRDHRRLYLE